jgi:hypothetical protein
MNIKNELAWIFFPSSTLIIIGILAINFPSLFKTIVGYTGRGLFIFILSLFLYICWGKLMGFLLILTGFIGVVYFIKEIFKKNEIVPVDVALRQETTTLALSKAFKFSKKRLKRSHTKNNN